MSAEPTSIELSFVIPCHNEQDNLRPLVAAIRAAVEPLARSYEIVLADDCSTDNTWPLLKELAAARTEFDKARINMVGDELAEAYA